MEKVIAKALIALTIGVTIGFFTGYTIKYRTYYWNNTEVSKARFKKEINEDVDKLTIWRQDSYSRTKPNEQEIIDHKMWLRQRNIIKKFNYKVALLSGSATASVIMLLLLSSELREKKEKH